MEKSIFGWLVPVALLASIPFGVSAQNGKLGPQRKTLAEISWAQSVSNRPGSGMQPGLDTVFVAGDGSQKKLYSLVFRVPVHTAIQPHSHPDDRSCFVLSGVWYFAYGAARDESKLKALPVGSSYTEPAGMIHFAGTKEQEAIVECTGVGPTDTTFVKPVDDPSQQKVRHARSVPNERVTVMQNEFAAPRTEEFGSDFPACERRQAQTINT